MGTSTMSVHDAQPQDIYVDAQGKLWRCVGTCSEPTAIFEEVEGHTEAPFHMGAAQAYVGAPPPPPIIKSRRSGGVTDLMWNGWKRVFRPEDTNTTVHPRVSE